MRVLVTGARGLIGRWALPLLQAQGAEVHALSRTPPPQSGGVRWHSADLLALGRPEISALLASVRPTHLLHLAWYTEHGRFWNAPVNLDWAAASALLVHGFFEAGGTDLVTAGTCAEYTWNEQPCDDQVGPTRPLTLYGVSKLRLWRTVERYAAEAGARAVHARIFHLYGPGEPPARFIPSIVRACLAGTDAVMSHGRQRRDLLHVRDAAGALVALLCSAATGAVNVGSGVTLTLAEVAQAAAAAAGRPELLRIGGHPAAPGDPELLIPVLVRLHEATSWRPSIPLEAGLSECVAWWRGR